MFKLTKIILPASFAVNVFSCKKESLNHALKMAGIRILYRVLQMVNC